MEIQALIEQLAGPDQKAASDALVEIGAPAVGPVLDVLCDEDSAVDWSTSATVLRRIGRPALDPLIEAMAKAPTTEVARRCGWAHSGLKIDDLSAFVPGLRHPSPEVRANTAYTLQLKGEAALPHASDLIALLDDPDPDVRQRVIWAIKELGSAVVPLLRDVRRSRSGRLRRPALEALAEVAGPAGLDDRDLAAVRRLIRVKQAAETPEPMHLCGTWFALPTGDQQAVLDAFDLSDPEPVTMRLGASAWNSDHHGWGADHLACSRTYVSPRLDGWTLVFGNPFHSGEDLDSEQLTDHCRALSTRFGAAHWYGASCGDDWTAWCVAEHGEVVRYYDIYEEDDQIGPPHPAEEGYVLPHIDPFPDDAFDGIDIGDSAAFQARECHATTFAARASVDPSALGPKTDVQGHAVLALTPCGRTHGHPRGALDI
ncbi:HEAT repeat domain-containing protein [Actinomadura sp. BRA 177]|uniref:HEAT repeat domain-containing protein n=1 Tax=Actinomadura sp. BRA 177 TaxID=2745202 RepID=UPI00159574B5|nr:HEAT repeat domain-containing protein [Actinomadura sp. BRA 177]NVI86450.1 HEAT repeat domain-containing protein [Actinomadura sp. BRA 177]